jgi:hypothetical protein
VAMEKEKDKPNTIVEYCKQLIRVGPRYRILQDCISWLCI